MTFFMEFAIIPLYSNLSEHAFMNFEAVKGYSVKGYSSLVAVSMTKVE